MTVYINTLHGYGSGRKVINYLHLAFRDILASWSNLQGHKRFYFLVGHSSVYVFDQL